MEDLARLIARNERAAEGCGSFYTPTVAESAAVQAEAAYRARLEALRGGSPTIAELECEWGLDREGFERVSRDLFGVPFRYLGWIDQVAVYHEVTLRRAEERLPE